MGLYQKIEIDIVSAMKSGDVLRRSVLVLLKAAIGNKAIEKQQGKEQLPDVEIEKIISTQVKRRRDAVAQYRAGGRDDKAQQEEQEVTILLEYLPPQLSEAEIEHLVQKVITDTGISDIKDFGKVMAALSSNIKGKADGALVAEIVKKQLSR